MATVNEKLTNLADEIRVLSGATDTLSLTEMAAHVNTANTDIAEMENLIAELEEALDGKSVTADEDVTTETNAYTELLGDLEAAVDALPDAGSGGGTGGVPTCTVVLAPDRDAEIHDLSYSYVGDNGEVTSVYERDVNISGTNRTLENVVCGSMMEILWSGPSQAFYSETIEELPGSNMGNSKAPTTPGSTGTITFIGDD